MEPELPPLTLLKQQCSETLKKSQKMKGDLEALKLRVRLKLRNRKPVLEAHDFLTLGNDPTTPNHRPVHPPKKLSPANDVNQSSHVLVAHALPTVDRANQLPELEMIATAINQLMTAITTCVRPIETIADSFRLW